MSAVDNCFALLPIPAWICDRETLALLDVNDSALSEYGYSREEFLRMAAPDIQSGEETTRGKESHPYVASIRTHRTKDGALIDAEINSCPIDFNGRPAILVLARNVTARVQLERMLALSEELHRLLVEAFPYPMLVTRDDRVAFINSSAARLFGAESANQLLGKPAMDLIHSVRHPAIWNRLSQLLAQGGAINLDEERIVRLDGSCLEVEMAVSLFHDQTGPAIQFVLQDVSQRKALERALRESEDRYRRFVEISPDAMFVNKDGRIVFVNPAAVRLFGAASANELIGKSPFDLYHPDCHAEVRERIRQIEQRGETAPLKELSIRALDGTAVPVETSATPFLEEGQPAIQVVLHDLSRRRQVEQERSELLVREKAARLTADIEATYHRMLDAVADAILEVDATGLIVRANARVEQLLGYAPEELIGQAVETLIPERFRDAHTHHRRAYLAHPAPRPMGTGLQLTALRKNGQSLPVDVNLSPLPLGDGRTHVVASVRDVTERTQAERERAHYQAELAEKNRQLVQRSAEAERANRLKSDFLASMSHELRSPLHTIIGFAELVLEDRDQRLSEKQKRFVGNIHRSSEHLLAIINDLLDISKIEAGRLELHLEDFDPSTLFEEVLAGIRGQAEAKRQRLETGLAQTVRIRADPLRFKQILLNLLSNALKFTPDGGTIRLTSVLQNGALAVSVSDTGVGIASEDQAAVFEKFYQVGKTTKGVREGTGLGLPITRRLVELQGGSIWLESEPGKGTTFTFTVNMSPHAGTRAGGSGRVL